MPTINDIHIASGPNEETYVPEQLRAGDGDFLTRSVTVLTGEVLAQYEVVARDATTGKFVAWTAAGQATEPAIGVTCYAVDATDADVEAAIFVAGYFNTAALVWDAAATDAQKEAAFDGTNITHRSLV